MKLIEQKRKCKKDCECDSSPDYEIVQTIKEVVEVLEREVSNYSTEYAPERIIRLRKYIQNLR